MPDPVERMVSLPIGVIVERRALDNPWQDHAWLPVEIVPGASAVEDWLEIGHGDGWVRYLVGSAPLELHRRETEAYKVNLSSDLPRVYVLLRTDDTPDTSHEIRLFLVTASPYEAESYIGVDGGILESVPMPPELVAWVQAFVDRHHVDEPFQKRKRKRHGEDAARTGRQRGNGIG